MALDWSDSPDAFIAIANRAYHSVPQIDGAGFYRVMKGN